MAYSDVFWNDWEAQLEAIYSTREEDVAKTLQKARITLDDFRILISPAAAPFVPQMTERSRRTTLRRFGFVMQLYAPLYLSNACDNICTYCGFSRHLDLERVVLNHEQMLAEAQALRKMGMGHILLVTGESRNVAGPAYLEQAIQLLRPYFAQISMEVQPLNVADYSRAVQKGLHAVMIYQETYRKDTYKEYHPKGRKSDFNYRLNAPDRISESGIQKTGLGVLLGLEDWRVDSYHCARHLCYLKRRYWRSRFSISFPRLRPCAAGTDSGRSHISDRELVQLISAYRLLDADLELSLSTRESAAFRDLLVYSGITTMSAASRTNPGGYANGNDSLAQFEIADSRSVADVAEMLWRSGYEPVYKDWDQALDHILLDARDQS